MRTNIEIDDDIMQAAMRGSEFKTKREAVEAGLKLLARQAHYREVLKWRGKLHWDDQPNPIASQSNMVMEKIEPYGVKVKGGKQSVSPAIQAAVKRKTAGVA
jgi:antitoxin ParD1/3/4